MSFHFRPQALMNDAGFSFNFPLFCSEYNQVWETAVVGAWGVGWVYGLNCAPVMRPLAVTIWMAKALPDL